MNENLKAADNLMEVIGFQSLNLLFYDEAIQNNHKEVYTRIGEATLKVGNLALRYSVRSILANDFVLAERYYNLALSFNTKLEKNKLTKTIKKYLNSKNEDQKTKTFNLLVETTNLLQREISYEPPKPFKIL